MPYLVGRIRLALLCHEILLYANPRVPIKIGCRRRALINSEGCDLCCIP
jgi:hypothetical protein